MENIQQQKFPLIIVYFHPNVDSIFLYRLFCWIFLQIISLTLYCFLMHYHGKNPVFPHIIEPKIMTLARWNDIFLLWECENISWKTSITSSWITENFFAILLPLLYLSSILSHNLHMFLYLNCLNPYIKHLDTFFKYTGFDFMMGIRKETIKLFWWF